MKISVITMQGVYNYGSALQTYATQVFFEKLGYEVEIIDYYPKRMRNYGSLKQIYLDAIPFHKKRWKCILVACCKYPSMQALRKVFVPFSESHIHKSEQYQSNQDLKKSPPIADVYCTGSDQVWNDYLEAGFDTAYFLDFAPKGKKKIAYAASFGRDDTKPQELVKVQRLLNEYSLITVREESGLVTLSETPVPQKECVIDPTFMLTRNEWMKIAPEIPQKDYILVYQLHEDSIVAETALRISKELGKPLIRISSDFLKRIKGGKTIVAPRVEEFVSYIANASLVVTDSFHATAFSINLNVPFISIQWKMFNDRIGTILRKTGLTQRSVSSSDDAVMICRDKINFHEANEVICQERVKSEMLFTKAFQE